MALWSWLLPPEHWVATTTSTVPDPAGEVATIYGGCPGGCWGENVAVLPPKVTAQAPSRLAPWILTLVPPTSGPKSGVTLVTVGAGGATIW